MKKMLSVLLALLMTFSVTFTDYNAPIVAEAATTQSGSSTEYGLVDDVQDGVILHCWDWSFNNIAAQMENIAAAGYSAIQTSPIQEAKEATAGVSNVNWWVFYQPKSFVIDNTGNSGLGTKAEFEAMCEVAHSYGIKVIVDIVANHTGNDGNGGIASTVISDIKNDSNCYHNYGNFSDIDYNSRYSITHDSMGMLPDLNTENAKIQNYVIGLLKECIDSGADGFRFDAAKHISVPSEGSEYTFWPNVINTAKSYAASKGVDLYCYGEILDDTGGPSISDYTQYMSVTDNKTSATIRNGVTNGQAASAATSYYQKGTAASNVVLWAESHDEFQNENMVSTYVSTSNIKKTWAMVASRANAAGLYYVRTTGWRTGMIGDICTWDWMSKEVSEANKFHNAFVGETEYLSYSGSIAVNERGTSGAILVNCSGNSTYVSVKANKMADGTYTDQVTGNKFTVSGGTISGQIGDTGIAVVYNPEPPVITPSPTISQEGGSFTSDTLTLTIGLKNATSGTYQIGSNSAVTYTSSKTITIGSDMSYGDSVTIKLTATDGATTTAKEYTFTKAELSANVAYLNLPSGWSSPVYCYAYDSATETVTNGTWPGEVMTYDSTSGYYMYEIPSNIESPRVIFYSSDSNRYPADMAPGLLFETDGSWLYSNGTWAQYTPPVSEGNVTIKYVNESNQEIAPSQTITGKVGTSYTTTAIDIDGYVLKTTPSNASGTYTLNDITVTYVYEEVEDTDPLVISSLATGSTFTSETKTITLTLKNAVSGTYTVDNGPVRTFTGSADVVLGQGKVADSVVTVTATATASDGTKKTFTFKYNKKFNGTVNEESSTVKASVSTYTTSSASTTSPLASQYSTNGTGTGVKKTITVDGNISDWDSSMIIAQGAANDDPRVYRENSMYEIPIDLYTLYAAWDDDNLYLMWEMTNVQDIVAPNDTYPLSQGVLYQTMNVPFFIAIDTGDRSTAIGNSGQLATGGTLWDSGITIDSSFNKLIAISTNGANGPFIYGGDSNGLNGVEESSYAKTGIEFNYGMGILSSSVKGINGGYGVHNGRVLSDMCNESAQWVDFNILGHNSATMDFHYEMSIPLTQLGVTASDVAAKGLGVMLVATMGKSGMDCLPYDLTMNDNADLPDTESQEFNSFEKSDADNITVSFARVGSGSPSDELELNFGADRSAPQTAGTALTLSGIAEGGDASYKYQFYVNNKLVDTISSSSSAETAWTPASAGTYIIKCVVTDSNGTSVTSAKYYTVEEGGEVIVEPVTGLTAAYEGGKIVLQWNDSGATGYMVARSDGRSGYTFLTYSATANGFVDTNVIKGQLYYYRIRPYVKDADGNIVSGELTDAVGVVATDKIPDKVTGVTATVKNGTVVLNWDQSDGARYYKISRASGATGKYYTVKYNLTETTYTDKVSKGLYRYKVVGYYKDTDGSWVYGELCDTLYVTVQ